MTSWRSATLRSRLLTVFAGFTVAVTLIFALSTAILIYTVEDDFLNAALLEEAQFLERGRATSQQWGAPRQSWMRVHESTASMPDDLRAQVAAAPRRNEFRGTEGRHYHIRQLQWVSAGDTASAWLVGEVSARLVVRPMRRSLLAESIAIELAVLALSAALALWLARGVTRPLSDLASAVRRLEFSPSANPIAVANADQEVAMVATALEEMRLRVQAFVEREQAFTRDTSHELRTPISVIRSTTAQVLHDPQLSPSSRRLLTFALQSAGHMERAVASLLALTREEALLTDGTPSPVRPILETVILEQSLALDARGLALRIDVPREAALPASEVVVHLLLSNLLGNAIAHAADGPVCIVWADHRLTFTNGVDPATVPEVDRLGVPGVKGGASDGTGLGLSIVQRLCARSGLSVEWGLHGNEFAIAIGEARDAGA